MNHSARRCLLPHLMQLTLEDEMAQKYLELINERAQRLELAIPKIFLGLNRE